MVQKLLERAASALVSEQQHHDHIVLDGVGSPSAERCSVTSVRSFPRTVALLLALACCGVPSDTSTPEPVVFSADASLTVHRKIATMVKVSWEELVPAEETWLSWEVDGVPARSPSLAREPGPASAVVLGVPAETLIDVVLHAVVDGNENTASLGSIETGPLPADLPAPRKGQMDPTAHRTTPWLLGSVDVGDHAFFGPCYTVILDLQGQVVWYRKTSDSRLTWQPKVSERGGYVLIDETTIYSDGIPEITKLTLDLEQETSIEMPRAGSAYDELDDGGIVYGEAENYYDYHLSKVDLDGTYTRLWSCYPWMESFSQASWACAPNTVRWNRDRGTLMWSMFDTDTVVELSMDGEMLAEYGRYPGGYTFHPPSSAFELQHFPGFTDEGTLLLSTHLPDGSEQWVREYEVDEDTMTLRQVSAVQGPEWAEYGGQVQRLPSGNLLWQMGTTGRIEELGPDGETVWKVSWPDHLVGNVTPIEDLYALTTGW